MHVPVLMMRGDENRGPWVALGPRRPMPGAGAAEKTSSSTSPAIDGTPHPSRGHDGSGKTLLLSWVHGRPWRGREVEDRTDGLTRFLGRRCRNPPGRSLGCDAEQTPQAAESASEDFRASGGTVRRRKAITGKGRYRDRGPVRRW